MRSITHKIWKDVQFPMPAGRGPESLFSRTLLGAKRVPRIVSRANKILSNFNFTLNKVNMEELHLWRKVHFLSKSLQILPSLVLFITTTMKNKEDIWNSINLQWRRLKLTNRQAGLICTYHQIILLLAGLTSTFCNMNVMRPVRKWKVSTRNRKETLKHTPAQGILRKK